MSSLLRGQTYKDKKITVPVQVSHNLVILGVITSFALCMIYALSIILTTTPKPLPDKNITPSHIKAHVGHHSANIDYKHVLKDIDSKYYEQCLNILEGKKDLDPHESWSKHMDDWYIYNNFFKHDAYHFSSSSNFDEKSDKKHAFGVYLDIGNFMPYPSNTAFFDLCLGWAGICMWSPNAVIDKISSSDRSCNTISHECLWGADSEFAGNRDATECKEVNRYAKDVLMEYEFLDKFGNIYDMGKEKFEIDYISLSIEGSELRFIQCWDFDELPVKVWSIQTLWNYKEALDEIMLGHGYMKFDYLSFDMSNPSQIFVRKDASYPYSDKTKHLWRRDSKCRMVKEKK